MAVVLAAGMLLIAHAAHPAVGGTATRDDHPSEHQRVFDKAVEQIRRHFYDQSTTSNQAFDERAAEFRSAAITAPGHRELYEVLNRYLGTFGVSHMWAAPRGTLVGNPGQPGAQGATRLNAGFGITRAGDSFVVSGVTAGSLAEAAGVKTGWILLSIDEVPALDVFVGKRWSPAGRQSYVFVFMDEQQTRQSRDIQPIVVTRSARPPVLPPDVRLVKSPMVDKQFVAALEEALDARTPARGVIVDLRGNPGGYSSDLLRAVGRFFTGKVSAGHRVDRRQRRIEMKSSGRSRATSLVPVVVLIDGNTRSSAEILSHVLKVKGRATLIGQVTAGQVLGTRVFPLFDTGDITIPVLSYLGPTGDTLEGKGVTPDILIDAPADGIRLDSDDYIQAALAHLQSATGLQP